MRGRRTTRAVSTSLAPSRTSPRPDRCASARLLAQVYVGLTEKAAPTVINGPIRPTAAPPTIDPNPMQRPREFFIRSFPRRRASWLLRHPDILARLTNKSARSVFTAQWKQGEQLSAVCRGDGLNKTAHARALTPIQEECS